MILQLTLYLTLIIRSLYKKNNLDLLAPDNENTCTKESPLKTHSSSTCSKSNSAVLAPSTPQEPASNYTHQSSLSQLNGHATANFNTEHDQHIENDLQSVNEHVDYLKYSSILKIQMKYLPVRMYLMPIYPKYQYLLKHRTLKVQISMNYKIL